MMKFFNNRNNSGFAHDPHGRDSRIFICRNVNCESEKGRAGKRKWLPKLCSLILAIILAESAVITGLDMGTVQAGDFIFINGSNKISAAESNELAKFVSEATITDKDGNPIKDDTLYVGESYNIHLGFTEKGAEGLQFDCTSDTLYYKIPAAFKVEPQMNVPLSITVDGREVEIGTYSIDEEGNLTVNLSEVGKEELRKTPNAHVYFNMKATAQAVEGGSDQDVHFGIEGQGFTFKIIDQPRISVEKKGRYIEWESRKGGTVEYTVTTKVEHGELHNTVVHDELTPPNTSAFEMQIEKNEDGSPAVTVTVKRKDGTTQTLTSAEFDLVQLKQDPTNPNKKPSFEVQLKDGCVLYEGDELLVSYNYQVDYVEGSVEQFWGNVVNNATVTGTMPVKEPDDPEGTIDVPVKEERGSNVEVWAKPPGHGVVSKDQAYDEMGKKLHYTLYTVVPAGTWKPLFIEDDMVVEYEGKRWYLNEFKDNNGRVENLTVKAVDVENWFDWGDTTSDTKKIEDLEKLKGEAKPLQGFNYNEVQFLSEGVYKPDGYDPNKFLEQYVVYWNRNGGKTLNIIFGLDGKNNKDGAWGHWDYKKDRLIITEYDLDMSDLSVHDELVLSGLDAWGEELRLSPDEVLLAGITNNVYLRFGNYRPGYSVYFNNAEEMNKTGQLDKNTNTIKYTVTLNTTDSTVNKYFRDVTADLRDNGWNYNKSMQAVFHDELPYGWKYVEGSLTVTAEDKYGNEQTFSEINPKYKDKIKIVTESTESGKGDEINAPLALFYNTNGTGNDNKNHESYNTFSENLAKLTITYELKATDEWLKKNGLLKEDTLVHNYAEIKDKENSHWKAETDVPYFPARLTKTAEQVGDSNLLRFSLKINNPEGVNLDPDKDYLIVTDKSEGLLIQTKSIKVKDADGNELNSKGEIESGEVLDEDEWGILPSTENGQFRLAVPDEKALVITYDAWITEMGENVEVSNEASIDGVGRSNSKYDESLLVNEIYTGGEGDYYSLTIEKHDSTNVDKKLSGAKFRLYLVLTSGEDSALWNQKVLVSIGNKDYACYTDSGMEFETGANGEFEFHHGRLQPGHYYILEELKAPNGYQLLEDKTLFYYGVPSGMDTGKYPNAKSVLPGEDTLRIGNEPLTYTLPETGGSGTSCLYLLAGVLLASGCVMLFGRKKFYSTGQ